MEGLVTSQQLASFYNRKRVFLTGHTGFKGTWLSAILFKLGARIKGYALEPEESKPFYELFSSYNYCESIIADIALGQVIAVQFNWSRINTDMRFFCSRCFDRFNDEVQFCPEFRSRTH